MPIRHAVRQGDSISRLAERHGLAPDTIWNDPANDDLRARRARMDVLLPGDEVVVPDLRPGEVECATGARHEFRRVGVPMLFEIQLFDERGAPAADRPYRLVVDGGERHGRTDAGGRLREYLPNTARRGRLAVEGEPERELLFGHLDPIETLSGVQKRLTNLGFACAQDAGRTGRATLQALTAFQRLCGLPATGALDDATREEVRACHDDPERLRAHLERPPAFGS
jgi:N-acetylmuramoyl-L-alanine amidase